MHKTDLQTAWIAALKSDDYQQTQGRLALRESDGSTQFCCLGVACDVIDHNGWNSGVSMLTWREKQTVIPNDYTLAKLGLSRSEAQVLAGLNDREDATFEDIALVLEYQLIPSTHVNDSIMRREITMTNLVALKSKLVELEHMKAIGHD